MRIVRLPKIWVREDRQRRLGDDGVVVEEPTPPGAAQPSDDPQQPGAAAKSKTEPKSSRTPSRRFPRRPLLSNSKVPASDASTGDSTDPAGTAGGRQGPVEGLLPILLQGLQRLQPGKARQGHEPNGEVHGPRSTYMRGVCKVPWHEAAPALVLTLVEDL